MLGGLSSPPLFKGWNTIRVMSGCKSGSFDLDKGPGEKPILSVGRQRDGVCLGINNTSLQNR